jgi:4-hydroxy-4-methyl-2-oxoglutarate aldolase
MTTESSESESPESAVAVLAGWDTPALSNALGRLNLGPSNAGFTDGSSHRIAGGTMCGFAVTATMEARHSGDNARAVSDLHRAVIDASGPVIVVLQDLDEPPGCGAFLGEVNGTLLAALQIAGFLTNGRVRDVDVLRGIGFAVHAAGLCVSRASMRLTAVNVPVTVAGLTVEPGDLLHGDEHGVLRIPVGPAFGLTEIAQEIVDEEQEVVRWARSGDFTPDGLLARPRVRQIGGA